ARPVPLQRVEIVPASPRAGFGRRGRRAGGTHAGRLLTALGRLANRGTATGQREQRGLEHRAREPSLLDGVDQQRERIDGVDVALVDDLRVGAAAIDGLEQGALLTVELIAVEGRTPAGQEIRSRAERRSELTETLPLQQIFEQVIHARGERRPRLELHGHDLEAPCRSPEQTKQGASAGELFHAGVDQGAPNEVHLGETGVRLEAHRSRRVVVLERTQHSHDAIVRELADLGNAKRTGGAHDSPPTSLTRLARRGRRQVQGASRGASAGYMREYDRIEPTRWQRPVNACPAGQHTRGNSEMAKNPGTRGRRPGRPLHAANCRELWRRSLFGGWGRRGGLETRSRKQFTVRRSDRVARAEHPRNQAREEHG